MSNRLKCSSVCAVWSAQSPLFMRPDHPSAAVTELTTESHLDSWGVTMLYQGGCKMSSLTRKLTASISPTSTLPVPLFSSLLLNLHLRLGYYHLVQVLGSCSVTSFSFSVSELIQDYSTSWVLNAPLHAVETMIWSRELLKSAQLKGANIKI